jgi:hypothetical protein
MRSTAIRACGLSLALLAVSCAPRLQVQTDYSPQADFTKLRTYAWLPRAQPASGDPRVDSGLVEGRVRRAVNTALAAKGFHEVAPSSEPDFYVAYQAAIENKINVRSTPTYYGYRGWWGRGFGPPVGMVGSSTTVHQYDLGTLVIDVIDRERDDLIWRGSAQAKLSKSQRGTPAERQEAMNEAVAQILEDFPPSGAK